MAKEVEKIEDSEEIKKDMLIRSTETNYLKVPRSIKKDKPHMDLWPNPSIYFQEDDETFMISYQFRKNEIKEEQEE